MSKRFIENELKKGFILNLALDLASTVLKIAKKEHPEIIARAEIIVFDKHEKTIKEYWPDASLQEEDNQTDEL